MRDDVYILEPRRPYPLFHRIAPERTHDGPPWSARCGRTFKVPRESLVPCPDPGAPVCNHCVRMAASCSASR